MRQLVTDHGKPYPAHAVNDPIDGRLFARSSMARIMFLTMTFRCTVCGRKLEMGAPRWGWVLLDKCRAEVQAQLPDPGDSPIPSEVRLPGTAPVLVPEGPAHEACLLYSMAECPFLRSSGWRYKFAFDAGAEHEHRPEGVVSGPKVAVSAARVNVDFDAGEADDFPLARPWLMHDVRLYRLTQSQVRRRLAELDDIEPPGDPVVDALQRCDDVQMELALTATSLFRAPSNERNTPCPCGSGNKFKRCHGNDLAAVEVLQDELRKNASNHTRGSVMGATS